jgi:hypothetical protein
MTINTTDNEAAMTEDFVASVMKLRGFPPRPDERRHFALKGDRPIPPPMSIFQ